ncbi:hypothetical protein GFD22_09640 [Bifidobacterium avesanii]|uniref:FAD:protein FMN transferase n=2 Tax=Bifidobacterium avesanii TaxID=1798157 RepID=A0A7K3TLS8_9BIFI|nr:hypothetical protein [Bifidobacterium avesanii]
MPSQAPQPLSPPTTHAESPDRPASEDPIPFSEAGAHRGHNVPTTCPQRHHLSASPSASPHADRAATQPVPLPSPVCRTHAASATCPQCSQPDADFSGLSHAASRADRACAQSQPSTAMQQSTPMSRKPNPAPPTWDSLARRDATRPTWPTDVERHGTTLVTRRPVWLDFGAAGKGYLVDLIAAMLHEHGHDSFVIDAGGDLRVEGLGSDPAHNAEPLRIALEDPADAMRAIGLAAIGGGSLCASSPSRRHWAGAHHLINALDGRPANDVAAAWAFVAHKTTADAATLVASTTTESAPHEFSAAAYPTALADGLATALFVADPTALRHAFPYECVILDVDRTARRSPGFPGTIFTR